eukprot:1141255-Pelagomonas_calceolata.AAC.1
MECPAGCMAVVWKYGLEAHFAAKHQQQQLEQKQPFILGPKEQKHMQQKVAKTACASLVRNKQLRCPCKHAPFTLIFFDAPAGEDTCSWST